MNAKQPVIAGLISVLLLTAGCSSSTEADAVDSRSFASDLASAVAAQNAAAFGGQTDDQVQFEKAFTENLSASAADAYADQSTYLAAIASNTSVLSTTVSVEHVSSASGTDGHTTITADLLISRALRDGPAWEEVIPYVSSIDNVTGIVDSLVVQDDAWHLAHND